MVRIDVHVMGIHQYDTLLLYGLVGVSVGVGVFSSESALMLCASVLLIHTLILIDAEVDNRTE